MILWRNTENYHFYHFDSDPRFPPFLLYVRWKSWVTFVRRCFRDANPVLETFPVEQIIRVVFNNYQQFSIKSYIVDIYKNRLPEAVIIDSQKYTFYGKNITFYPFNTNPRFSLFHIMSSADLVLFCTEMFP